MIREKTIAFGEHVNAHSVNISLHVDSIQALMVYGYKNEGLVSDIFLQGREVSSSQSVDDIVADPLYLVFTSLRSQNRRSFITELAAANGVDFHSIRNPSMTATNRTNGEFTTAFYSYNQLVDAWSTSDITAATLMPVFGGLTELTIGSDYKPSEELSRIGKQLRQTIADRQLAGMSLSTSGVDLSSNRY